MSSALHRKPGLAFARHALGLAFVLLAGYPAALAGNYEILRGEPPKKLLEEMRKN